MLASACWGAMTSGAMDVTNSNMAAPLLARSISELLFAYKRQPTIEKRFTQLKTDFAVAPVYLKPNFSQGSECNALA